MAPPARPAASPATNPTADPVASAERWLRRQALPLWAGPGMDTGIDRAPDGPRGAWEELDLEGRPLARLPKRLRVQARQVHVFATAARLGFGDPYAGLATEVWDFLTGCGFDPGAGGFARVLEPDGAVRLAGQDLYDLAFVLLALAALARTSPASAARWLPLWWAALERHRAPEGWHETPQGAGAEALPRRQNPHMHLFEAAVAAYAATADARFLMLADACLVLFRTRFLDPASGLVLEHFAADWTPVPPGRQLVEPGHMMEWVFLLAEYTRVTGRAHGVDLRGLFDRALAIGACGAADPDAADPGGGPFLCDVVRPWGAPAPVTRRFWPQTEVLRASCALEAAGERLPASLRREALLAGPFAAYLAVPVPGGWHDRFDADGRRVSASMPASTLYHVFGAICCAAGL